MTELSGSRNAVKPFHLKADTYLARREAKPLSLTSKETRFNLNAMQRYITDMGGETALAVAGR
jgi:hypothetical protein